MIAEGLIDELWLMALGAMMARLPVPPASPAPFSVLKSRHGPDHAFQKESEPGARNGNPQNPEPRIEKHILPVGWVEKFLEHRVVDEAERPDDPDAKNNSLPPHLNLANAPVDRPLKGTGFVAFRAGPPSLEPRDAARGLLSPLGRACPAGRLSCLRRATGSTACCPKDVPLRIRPRPCVAQGAFAKLFSHIEHMSKMGWGVAALCALSAMAVAYGALRAMAESSGGTGIFSLVLGGLAALAAGGALVALQFWSQRKGFDERAGARPELWRKTYKD